MASALGSAMEIDWDGFKYKFSPLTDGVKADYTAWLKSSALGDLETFAANAETRKHIWDNLTSKRYDWQSDLSVASLNGAAGLRKMVELLTNAAGQSFDLDEIGALVDAKTANVVQMVKFLNEDSLPKSRAAFLEEKAQRKAKGTKGSPVV